jgi:hypothetical protein
MSTREERHESELGWLPEIFWLLVTGLMALIGVVLLGRKK